MPNTFARSTGRVSIDASVHDFYKQLTTGKSSRRFALLDDERPVYAGGEYRI